MCGRRHRRIGRDVVVGVAEIVRHVEHEPGEHDAEARHEEAVLHGGIGRERDGVLVGLRLDAGRIVLPDHVQRPDVQHHDAGDHERQQIVQREEALQRRIADRVAAPQPGRDRFTDQRDRREEVGDDGGAPEAHLAPRQRVAEEAGRHHQQIEDDAEDPEHLARLLVGAVVHAAGHVDVDGDEEHRGAVGMQIAKQPPVVHVAHDVLDGVERHVGLRGVVHRQDDAGDDLRAQQERQDAAERPPVVEVARRRIGDEGGMHQPCDRQATLHPFHEGVLRLVSRMSAHIETLNVGRVLFTDPDPGIGEELIGREIQVLRRRTLPDAARGVVLRAVAGAEPAVVVALVGERDAAEMGADADQDQPLVVAVLDAVGVGLRIGQARQARRPAPLRFLSRCGG